MGKVFALVWFDGVFHQEEALRLADGMATTSGTATVASSWFDLGTKIENVNVPRLKRIAPPPMLHLPSK